MLLDKFSNLPLFQARVTNHWKLLKILELTSTFSLKPLEELDKSLTDVTETTSKFSF
jgi:hypothetical protein